MNDQEYITQYKQELEASLREAQPLVELTPELIEQLWQQGVSAVEQKQTRRKTQRMSLLRQSLSIAASIALLIGIGLMLWAPQDPQGPVVAETRPQTPTPVRESPAEEPIMLENSRKPSKTFENFESFENPEAPEAIEPLEEALPPTPSAIRTLTEAEYYALLCSLIPDDPTPTAPDLPEESLAAPDTLPVFYQPTLRDYLAAWGRQVVCERMPFLCSND